MSLISSLHDTVIHLIHLGCPFFCPFDLKLRSLSDLSCAIVTKIMGQNDVTKGMGGPGMFEVSSNQG